MKTRIFSYILPVYPFLAILVAATIFRLLKKYRLVYCGIVCLATVEMLLTVSYRAHTFSTMQKPKSYFEGAMIAKSAPTDTIEYFVETSAQKVIGSIPTKIPYHTKYGAIPCLAYYTDKKLHILYKKSELTNAMKQKHKYFFMSTHDEALVSDIPHTIIFKNKDYIFFKT